MPEDAAYQLPELSELSQWEVFTILTGHPVANQHAAKHPVPKVNLITGSDQLYLSNLTKTIFRGYLDSYINVECRYLNDKCASVLQRYYADKGHQKKASASAAGTVVQVRVTPYEL